MRTRQGGFSLVEMLIVMAVMATMLSAVWTASDMVGASVVSGSKSAEVTSRTRGTLHDIGRFVRPGKMTTILAQAVQADVVAGRAASVGQWIFPTDGIARTGFRFQSARGKSALNAGLSNRLRSLSFTLESGELENGVDDDGDGLVDEGDLVFSESASPTRVVRRLEECSFTLQGRLLTVTVRSAGADEKGTVYRVQMDQGFYLRNN